MRGVLGANASGEKDANQEETAGTRSIHRKPPRQCRPVRSHTGVADQVSDGR
jgi:hypothetical protein